jgi:hypothetical protein
MARTGTNDIQSLLANNTSLQSIAGFGLDNLADIITQDLDAWNATINDAVGEIAEVSTDRLRGRFISRPTTPSPICTRPRVSRCQSSGC